MSLLLLFSQEQAPSGPVTRTGHFTIGAWVDAGPGQSWGVGAVIAGRTRALFDIDAYTAHTILISAWIRLVRTFGIDAVLRRAQAGSFVMDAAIGDRPNVWLVDAYSVRKVPGSFPVKGWLVAPERGGSFPLDAFLVGTRGDFVMDAQISSPATVGGAVELDAVVSDTYRRSGFDLGAVVHTAGSGGLFDVEAVVALVPSIHSFPVDALIPPWFALGAFVAQSFQMSAEIWKPGQSITFDAQVLGLHFGWVAFDAVVARGYIAFNAVVKASPHDIIPFIAWVRRLDQSFGLDARVADHFGISAYVQPSFTVGAFISSDSGQKYWPPGSGGPGNPGPIDPGTGEPWLPPHHQVRIEIFIDGKDMTAHVELAQCMFEQHAGSSPGSFSLPLRGAFPKYDGGEEIRVDLDGFRQFGGFVTNVTHGYHYPYVAGEDKDEAHPNQQPLTLLEGTDFNVLFDRVYIYNVPDVGSRTHGIYTTIDPLPMGLTDKEYISAVLSKYIDPPWRRLFDFTTYVEVTGNSPSPEQPFTVETGQTLRQFLTSLSQMTNAIWYMDPYYAIHSHSRANANAPRAITDGTGTDSGGDPTGGIHCRELSVEWTIESTMNDVTVYGTLAETVEGQIIFSRRQDQDLIDKVGLWQYQEFRSDLHLQSHVSERAGILKSRADRVIHRAVCKIFEKGFQAGQVVSLFSGEYDVAENIPITVMSMTFALSQGADEDGKCYGVPVYELQMSNDPEPPFNLYDALPWEFHDLGDSPSHPRFQMPHVTLTTKEPGNTLKPCVDNGWVPLWAPGDPLIPDGSIVVTDPMSPPPWCIVVRMAGGPQPFSISQLMLPGDHSGYSDPAGTQSSMFAQLGFIGHWFLSVHALGQTGSGNTTDNSPTIVAPITPGVDNYARIQCLLDGTVRIRLWPATKREPEAWTLSATPSYQPGVDMGVAGHLGLASRLGIQGTVEVALAGDQGKGWVWFDSLGYVGADLITSQIIYSPYLPWTWGVIKYPGGTRPAGVDEGTGGNVLDAESAPYSFPRGDIYEITPEATHGFPGQFSTEYVMHRYDWGFSYVPSTISGNFDDPRMLRDCHNYIGFKPPPGATRFHFEAFAYINVYETGAASIGSQPPPSGEGAISFEVLRTWYSGLPGEPAELPIMSSTSPDYNYGPGEADLGHIKHAYGVSYHADITDQELVQIGGKITLAPDALMKSHGPGPLLVNGMKRVAELKLWNVRVSFEWDPVEGGNSDSLGPCLEDEAPPVLEHGWFSEMVEASKPGGYFSASRPVAPATLNVYLHGVLLMPDDDWVQVEGSKTQFILIKPGPRCLRLVYMALTAGIETHRSTTRETSRNVGADMDRLNDVRPV
jgi:hypothetical protein